MMTDGLIPDSVSFLLMIAILALFWFRPWRRRRVRVLNQARTKAEPNLSLDVRNKAA
jgi:hypothetical protein